MFQATAFQNNVEAPADPAAFQVITILQNMESFPFTLNYVTAEPDVILLNAVTFGIRFDSESGRVDPPVLTLSLILPGVVVPRSAVFPGNTFDLIMQ